MNSNINRLSSLCQDRMAPLINISLQFYKIMLIAIAVNTSMGNNLIEDYCRSITFFLKSHSLELHPSVSCLKKKGSEKDSLLHRIL